MSYQITFEDVKLFDENLNGRIINVEMSLTCIEQPVAPSGRDEHFDPGSGGEWETDTIEIAFEKGPALSVSYDQFRQLFPQADALLEKAYAAAAENGDPSLDVPDYDEDWIQ